MGQNIRIHYPFAASFHDVCGSSFHKSQGPLAQSQSSYVIQTAEYGNEGQEIHAHSFKIYFKSFNSQIPIGLEPKLFGSNVLVYIDQKIRFIEINTL